MPTDSLPGYDAWKTRTPEDQYIGPIEVCDGCGYFIDECACEEPDDE